MKNRLFLKKFLARSAIWVAAKGSARGVFRVIPFVSIALLLAAGFDHWFEIPLAARQILWVAGVLAVAAIAASGFFPFDIFSLKRRSFYLHQSLIRKERKSDLRADELLLVSQFLKREKTEGLSSQLLELYLDQKAEDLKSVPPRWCFPVWKARMWGVASAVSLGAAASLWAVFPAHLLPGSRILFPFVTNEVDTLVKVEPGNALVSWGSDVEIKVTLLARSINKPALYVRRDNHWSPVESETDLPGATVYRFKGVVQPLVYRAKWKSDWGRRYTITPVQPIRIESINVTIRPPAYVKKELTNQSSPEITGLIGSVVTVEGTTNKPVRDARLTFEGGREKNAGVLDEKKISAHFSIDRNDTYGFRLTGLAGDVSSEGVRYPIHVVADQPPAINLLSPDQDLVIGERERVPLTFDVKDDFGVQDVYLIWEGRDRRQRRERIRHFESAVENGIFSYSWDLGREKFQTGEVVRYQLEAVDGNVVSGPGKSQTAWHILEIASFEKEHDYIEKALEIWRDKAVDLLADVNVQKAKLGKENPDMNQMAADFNKAAQKSLALEEALRQIVKKMENDPLADYGLWLEHKAMTDSLNAMNQNLVKNTQAAMMTQNKEAAKSNLEEMSAELERMSALSERLSKTQNARDVTNAGQNLESLGEDMEKALEDAASEGKLDAETMKRVNDMMQQAQQLIQDMAKALQSGQKDLPEDFVNQKALKDLKLGESQDIMSKLADAVKKGNAKEALNLARQFLNAARQMSKQLSEANESFLKENSADELSKEIGEQAKKLEEIANDQRKIMMETQKLESKRLNMMLKAQEEMLLKLAKRQRKAIDTMVALIREPNFDVAGRAVLQSQISPMLEVAEELEAKLIDKSLQRLPAIISQIQMVQTQFSKSTAMVGFTDRLLALSQEEKAILDALSSPPPVPQPDYSPQEQQAFNSLQTQQQALKEKTQTLKKSLQTLSRKTASIGQPVTQSLSAAGNEMKGASEELGKKSSGTSLRMEENALNHLLDSQEALQQAQDAMGEMASQQGGTPGGEGGGSPGGRPVRVIQRSGGQSGTHINKVRLPTAEDYKPPKEFREELLESLREKYPKTYEEIIHKYYKRLAE